jgi:hypothetical protein
VCDFTGQGFEGFEGFELKGRNISEYIYTRGKERA